VLAAQREIAEAYDLTTDQLNSAALDILSTSAAPASPPAAQHFEHLGGVAPHQFSDINKRSTSPAQHVSLGGASSDEDEPAVFITTL